MGNQKTTERPTIGASEAQSVLACYRLGDIESIRTYHGGSSNAPKVRVYCSMGEFLLKRVAPSRADIQAIRQQHQMQQFLRRKGFPVPMLAECIANEQTLLEHGDHLYELMAWAQGDRYSYDVSEATSVGITLASMHGLLEDFVSRAPHRSGFHDRRDVAKAAIEIGQSGTARVRQDCETIAAWLGEARRATRDLWADLPMTVAHGDWHPGNLLLRGGSVIAVIDWESARAEPRVADLANCLLQFSLRRSSRKAPMEWPIEPNMELLKALSRGYNLLSRAPLTDHEIELLPDLTIEALSAEAIVPLFRKGRLREYDAAAVLPWVVNRLHWIRTNRDNLQALLVGT